MKSVSNMEAQIPFDHVKVQLLGFGTISHNFRFHMQFRTGTVCNPEMLNFNICSDMVMNLAEAEAVLVTTDLMAVSIVILVINYSSLCC